jgi:hypothetical protein
LVHEAALGVKRHGCVAMVAAPRMQQQAVSSMA